MTRVTLDMLSSLSTKDTYQYFEKLEFGEYYWEARLLHTGDDYIEMSFQRDRLLELSKYARACVTTFIRMYPNKDGEFNLYLK